MMSRAVVTSAFCRLRVPIPNLLICPIAAAPALKVIAVVVTLIVPSPPRPTKPLRFEPPTPTPMTTPPVRLSVVEASATIVAPRYWESVVDASMLIAPLIVLVPEIARTAPCPSMPRLTLLLPGLRAIASAIVIPSATSRAELSTPDKVTPPIAVPRAFAAVTRTAP